MPPHAAAAELVRCAGAQFDPEVVGALLAIVQAGAPADERPLAA
jgi:HD-GYP domain-containing protein (c-di-GMP phosphodiesterase class II)